MYSHETKLFILIKISPRFIPEVLIDDNPELVQVMAFDAK